MHKVKDLTLKEQGEQKLKWVESRMKVVNSFVMDHIKEKPLNGINIGMSLHLEAKTAILAASLERLGASVSVTSSNPLTAQDDVAAALTERVSHVYAWRGETPKEYDDNHRLILNDRPNIIIDDGADLSIMAIETKRTKDIIGAAEETTTGVKRFKALEREHLLKFPVIAVNDAKGKYLYDSRFGTGQSSVDGILRSTNMMIGGKRAVVAGYGWVGRGVASRLRGMGANVTVVEVDPYRALEAYFDGYTVNGMDEASQYGDLFITCTGNVRIITLKHFEKMKDGAVLLNVGHFDVEVDARALRQNASSIKDARPNVQEFTMKGGKKLYLIAEGRLANLAAADGHPIEVMDLTFGLQLQSAIYLAKNHQKMKDIVYKVPDDIDELTVRRFLELNGIRVDRLTDEQKKYQKSWQEMS